MSAPKETTMDKAMSVDEQIERHARAWCREIHDGPDAWDKLAPDEQEDFLAGSRAALDDGVFDLVEAAEETYAARWDTGIRCSTGPFLGALGRLGRAVNRMKEQSND